jgi:hypothetical protein
MSDAQHTLRKMKDDLERCAQGRLMAAQLSRSWREAAGTLALPPRFEEVLAGLLDRLEAGALFNEESCSFSQHDLLDSLRMWADKAAPHLN